MSYISQWNQYTSYAVGALVLSSNITYICILATRPSATPPASAPSVWSVSAAAPLPSGLTTYASLSWTPDAPSNSYAASITGVSPSLGAGSKLSSTLQFATGYTATDVNKAAAAWLIAAQPSAANGGTITFTVANSGTSPSGPSQVLISWAVVAY